MMTRVELLKGLTVDDDVIDAFAVRNGIVRLALFGSALRDDFGPRSDIDLLVEFAPDRVPGLLHLAEMEAELESILGQRVDLRTYEDLSQHFRDDVSANARRLYAA